MLVLLVRLIFGVGKITVGEDVIIEWGVEDEASEKKTMSCDGRAG